MRVSREESVYKLYGLPVIASMWVSVCERVCALQFASVSQRIEKLRMGAGKTCHHRLRWVWAQWELWRVKSRRASHLPTARSGCRSWAGAAAAAIAGVQTSCCLYVAAASVCLLLLSLSLCCCQRFVLSRQEQWWWWCCCCCCRCPAMANPPGA